MRQTFGSTSSVLELIYYQPLKTNPCQITPNRMGIFEIVKASNILRQ